MKAGAARTARDTLAVPMTDSDPQTALQSLRQRIDDHDAEMHRQLVGRGELISKLIATKKSREPGNVFKPVREADMMRRLRARHSGPLPMEMVEHIWREIIATFTQVQAPYRVYVAHGDTADIRDLARFLFGFATPLVSVDGGAVAFARLEAAPGDLALVPLPLDAPEAGAAPWWHRLSATGVRVIARYPFLDPAPVLARPDALVLGAGAIDVDDFEIAVLAVTGVDNGSAMARLVAEAGGEVLAGSGGSRLVAVGRDRRSGIEVDIRAVQPAASVALAGGYAAPLSEAR